jgi:hypothetical protein
MPLHRKTPLRRGGRIRPKKRTASEFARIYGSRKRAAWVRSLLCTVDGCGDPRESENAHVANGGTGRKADHTLIVPLCPWHHRQLHSMGIESFQEAYHMDRDGLEAEAKLVEARWQAHCSRASSLLEKAET